MTTAFTLTLSRSAYRCGRHFGDTERDRVDLGEGPPLSLFDFCWHPLSKCRGARRSPLRKFGRVSPRSVC
jgi:hypothetical protein